MRCTLIRRSQPMAHVLSASSLGEIDPD